MAPSRPLAPTLRSPGMAVRFAEARDGDTRHAWRDRLGERLPWLFPGP